jgi:hypothetical protein
MPCRVSHQPAELPDRTAPAAQTAAYVHPFPESPQPSVTVQTFVYRLCRQGADAILSHQSVSDLRFCRSRRDSAFTDAARRGTREAGRVRYRVPPQVCARRAWRLSNARAALHAQPRPHAAWTLRVQSEQRRWRTQSDDAFMPRAWRLSLRMLRRSCRLRVLSRCVVTVAALAGARGRVTQHPTHASGRA